MSFAPAALYASPNALAEHYSRFRVSDRLLLTGHSHQAWPDCAWNGQRQAFEDAAAEVDGKWERAFERADRVRDGYRRLLDDPSGLYSLSASTHDLLVKLLSALPLARRPKLVSTDHEFYSLRRQLDRLEEEGIEVVRVAGLPAESVGERLAAATCDRTAAVLASTVYFDNAHRAGAFERAAETARKHGAILVLDVYHQLNVVPFSLRDRGLEDAYVVTAGYKYCQLGEGNAILRFPANCALRPVATGWFAEFGELTKPRSGERVAYSTGNDRFAGATYDPTSHYRAAEVFDFFDRQGLTPELLREVSQHQIGLLASRFDALDLDPAIVTRDRGTALQRLGGFLALQSPRAAEIWSGLREAGVMTDHRGEVLRLGPAPYLSDRQLEQAIEVLGRVVQTISPTRVSRA